MPILTVTLQVATLPSVAGRGQGRSRELEWASAGASARPEDTVGLVPFTVLLFPEYPVLLPSFLHLIQLQLLSSYCVLTCVLREWREEKT